MQLKMFQIHADASAVKSFIQGKTRFQARTCTRISQIQDLSNNTIINQLACPVNSFFQVFHIHDLFSQPEARSAAQTTRVAMLLACLPGALILFSLSCRHKSGIVVYISINQKKGRATAPRYYRQVQKL
jgi:hypothetical protein